MIRVVVQDRLPLVRLGFATMLDDDPHTRVVAEATTGAEVVQACRTEEPDVIVCELADDDIADTVARCRALRPDVRIVAVHLGRESDHRAFAEELGVELLSYAANTATVRAAVAGEPRPAEQVEIDSRTHDARTLTMAERKLLGMLDQGLSSSAAAREMGVGRRAVERAAVGAREAFGTLSLQVAVQRARRAGVLPRRPAH